MRIKMLVVAGLLLTTFGWSATTPDREAQHLAGYCLIHLDDWRAQMRLCQVSEARGQYHLAELSATRLQRLWATRSDPGLCALDRFLRASTPTPSGRLCVYEHFASGPTHHWDVVDCDVQGRPQCVWIVHTNPRTTVVQLVDFEVPSARRTVTLPHRIRTYADLRQQLTPLLALAKTP